MICPYCGKRTPDQSEYCAECGYPLTERAAAQRESGDSEGSGHPFDPIAWQRRVIPYLKGTIIVLLWIVSLTIIGYAAYKIYYWNQTWKADS